MTEQQSNIIIQRALRAEKKAEKLEKELEILRTRTMRKSELQNTDKATFQLNEQLSIKTEESQHLQENLSTRTGEYEGKLKKMREIFAQATKNIDKYRATISTQEHTISRVNEELAEANQKISDLNSALSSQKYELETTKSEMKQIRTNHQSELDHLEAGKRQLSNQLEQTKNDYEQYKKRAHQLLEQKSNQTDHSRINELQNQVKQLEMGKINYETDLIEKTRKITLMDQDIRQSLDHIRELKAKLSDYQDIKNESIKKQKHIEQLQQQIITDRDHFDKTLKATNERHDEMIQQLTNTTVPNSIISSTSSVVNSPISNEQSITTSPIISKTSEELTLTNDDSQRKDQEEAIERVMEYLNEENTKLRHSLKEKDIELTNIKEQLDQLHHQLLQEQSREINNNNDNILDAEQMRNGNHVDVYESMMNLLSPLVTRQEPSVNVEKQANRLREMLQESEEQVIALRKQEKILKDEIRKLDSMDKRQNMNVEYIKNVLLKFLMSDNKEFLVPVLAKILFLDQNETEQLQNILDVLEGETTEGASIIMWTQKSSDNYNQLWRWDDGFLTNMKSKLVLDIRGGDLKEGSSIVQFGRKLTIVFLLK
ncbi:unnamed protein product [Cunninghamella echinulata]